MHENDSSNETAVPAGGWSEGFGERLCRVMERAGVAQTKLAEMTGLSAMHINHFMCSRRAPNLENLARLLSALWWVDARELIYGAGVGGLGGTGEQSGATGPEPRQVVRISEWLESLAETFERRAHEWENAGATRKPIEGGEAFAALYREMSEDLRSESEKLSNDDKLCDRREEAP